MEKQKNIKNVVVDLSDEYFINKFNKSQIHQSKIDSLTNEERNFLEKRFNDSDSIKESIFRIIEKIENKPLCPECGKPVKIQYRKTKPLYHTCGSKECIHKRKYNGPATANLIKYGVKNQFEREEIKEKIILHNLEKYNKKSHTQNDEWKTQNEKHLLEKTGYKNCFSNPKIIEKIKNTNIQKYGVEHISKTKEWKEKMSNICSSKEWQEKRRNTLLKNNSWNKSIPEEKIYEKLINKFNNVYRQYISDKYPFKCDFYIEDIDLFIEYNGTWLHGFMPFDENNLECINKLNKWKEKSINSNYFKTAIEIWTIKDVNKRNIAKENKLNYIEFWNLNEFNEWYEKI